MPAKGTLDATEPQMRVHDVPHLASPTIVPVILRSWLVTRTNFSKMLCRSARGMPIPHAHRSRGTAAPPFKVTQIVRVGEYLTAVEKIPPGIRERVTDRGTPLRIRTELA